MDPDAVAVEERAPGLDADVWGRRIADRLSQCDEGLVGSADQFGCTTAAPMSFAVCAQSEE